MDTHQDCQNRESSKHGADKGKRNHNGRALRIAVEDVVDFRKLAVSRGLNRRDRNIRVAGDQQRERSSIVSLRAAERADKESCVDGLGNGKELNRKVFLGLKRRLAAIQDNVIVPARLTSSSLDLPFSFTLNGYEISRPVSGSCRRRNT